MQAKWNQEKLKKFVIEWEKGGLDRVCKVFGCTRKTAYTRASILRSEGVMLFTHHANDVDYRELEEVRSRVSKKR